ncbi:MAG: hypothetical protein K2J08_05045 [Ruminococcus sp.]|nr:hypothetical protein [Ruminococcus sp.]
MDFRSILEQFDDKSVSNSFRTSEIEQNRVQAILPYLIPILFFLPIVSGTKDSEFNRFHANQQLTWLLVILVIGVVKSIIGIIPLIGWLVRVVIEISELLIAFGLMYGASQGMALKLPFVGDLIKIF